MKRLDVNAETRKDKTVTKSPLQKISHRIQKTRKIQISTLKPLTLLFVLLVFSAGAYKTYGLFYIPDEGRQIKIAEDTTKTPYFRFFEKVEVLELSSKDEAIAPSSSEGENRDSTSVYAPTTTPPTTPPIQQPQKQAPISINEVLLLSNKLTINELKDGSVIELHISESHSEVFRIYVLKGAAQVIEGESPDEDIELWISKSAFKELLATYDILSTAKRLASEGEIAVTQKSSTWTLWRRGYKGLARKLGLV